MNNKTLTVSHGTFSCTLEGFEDSFEMMKIVAEYFQNLAEEDPSFGTKPVQMDTDTLAKLAQEETSHHVEASEKDGHYVLSATDEPVTSDAPTSDVPAAAVATGAVALGAIASELSSPSPSALNTYDVYDEDTGAQESELEPTRFEDMEAEAFSDTPPATESAVDKLQRIRDVVELADTDAEEETYDDEPADAETLTDVASDEDAGAETEVDADVIAADSADDADEQSDDVEDVSAEAEQDVADATSEDIVAVEESVEPDMVDETAEDIAEDDVAVSEDVLDAEDTPELTNILADEADTDEADTEDTAEEDAAALDTLSEDLADDTAGDLEVEMDLSEEIDLADDEAETIDELVEALNPTMPEDLEAEAKETAEQKTKEELNKVLGALADDDAAIVDEGEAEEANATDDVLKLVAEIETDSEQDEMVEAEAETAEADSTEDRKRVRVIKVSRSDMQDAAPEDTLESTEDDAIASDDVTDSGLTDSEEAELLADLAQVEAQFAEDAASEAEKPAVMGDAADTLPALADHMEDGEAKDVSFMDTDVNRLMDEADEQMDEPENAKRRSAFQALKAAVLARKADKQMSSEDELGDDVDAYRSDLAKVVQPSRSEDVTRPERPAPAEASAAPLRLVAEQLVSDTEEEDVSEAPAAPSEVASEEAAPVEVGNFADYCTQLGAHDLSAVLEAAASYLTFIEGRKQFSRPQLMMTARQVDEKEEFSREDGLRSFGQLLRSGKIEKIQGGRFAVTSDIGYKPDQRAAG
ncbi:MAG: hypothetical protein ABJM43_07940 [Paracoccaceae bacterium]